MLPAAAVREQDTRLSAAVTEDAFPTAVREKDATLPVAAKEGKLPAAVQEEGAEFPAAANAGDLSTLSFEAVPLVVSVRGQRDTSQ